VRDRLPLLAFALAVVVGALALVMMRASRRGEFAEPFSTYRSEPDGARALFLLAQQAGLPVARRHLDLEPVEGEPELVLLGIEGDEPETDDGPDAGALELDRWERGRLSKYESDELLKALDRGATLIYAVTRDHPFLGDLGVTFTPAEDHLSRTLTPFSPSPLTQGVHTLQTRISGYLSAVRVSVPGSADDGGASKAVGLGADALPVLIDRHHGDQAVALLIRRGQGRVLVLAAPTMASNRELVQDDAARFWLNALTDLAPASGDIEFDEYHHGFTGDRSLMGYASRYGLPWVIGQGIFALALWSLALRRFGAQRTPVEDSRRAGADYLLAMARIYRLGKHRQHAAAALVRGSLRALQGAARLPRRTELETTAQALEAGGQAELAQELRALSVQLSATHDEAELVALARRAAELRLHAQGAPSPTPSTSTSNPTPGASTP
jgi:hypothetical protein